MTLQMGLTLSAILFVGTHFLLSHPLRRPLVGAVGELPFRGIYSLISLLTFGAMVYFYAKLGREPRILPEPGDVLWIVASLLMWLASILLVGSFFKNPALVGSAGPRGGPAGVLRITRHPMMWAFALWAIVHFALVGMPKSLVFDGAILILALAGAAAQDMKKGRRLGADWHDWTAQTAFVPFTRGIGNPGLVALIGGTILFFAATWLHPYHVGFWRWIA
jgi:uncharacterized membrane protein